MSGRALVSLCSGRVPLELWVSAAEEEPRMSATARCRECPLRDSGEWREGLDEALTDATPSDTRKLRRWNCHRGLATCGGMLDAVGDSL